MSTPPAADKLASLLADTTRAGVRPLPIGSADRLLDAAGHNGFQARHLDLSGCTDKTTLLTALADAFAFPDWFGHNWDALADSLGDLSWLPAPGYVLLLERAAPLRNQRTEDFDTLLAILRDTSEDWRSQGIPFWTFVDLSAGAADAAQPA